MLALIQATRTATDIRPTSTDITRYLTVMPEITIHTEEGRYFTIRELCEGLAKFRGKRIPRSTLYDWMNILNISRDEVGCFSSEDFTLLARYAVWLQRGGLSKGFISINNIQQKEPTHEPRQQQQQRKPQQQQKWQGIPAEAPPARATGYTITI